MLISRTPSRLEEAAQAITDKFGVEVRTIPADLTSTEDAVFDRIQAGLKGLDIGILVNNAGMSFSHPEYHHLMDDKVVQDVIIINTISLTRVRTAGGRLVRTNAPPRPAHSACMRRVQGARSRAGPTGGPSCGGTLGPRIPQLKTSLPRRP